MSIRIRQDAQYKGGDWWHWSVWLAGAREDLDQIDHVIYTLHPTFPDPVRRVGDRKTGFRLSSAGWGEFEVYLELVLKNGQRRRRKHTLKLEYPEPEKTGEAQKRRGPARARKPRVFLSSGIADRSLAEALREALAARDVDVTTGADAPAGLPLEKAIGSMLGAADAAVFVLSAQPSPYLEREVNAALAAGVRAVVPVLVGVGVQPPEELQRFEGVRIADSSDIAGAAEQIIARALPRPG